MEKPIALQQYKRTTWYWLITVIFAFVGLPQPSVHGFKPFPNGIYGMEYPTHSVIRCLGTDGI